MTDSNPICDRLPHVMYKYLIECQKCGKQYVEETENPLHLRLNSHESHDYQKHPDKPVGIHFNTLGYTFGDIMIMVVEQMCMASAACRNVGRAGSTYPGH